MQQGIFTGRTAVRYPYGCYGYTRGGGRRWHGGLDVVAVLRRQNDTRHRDARPLCAK